MLMAILWPSPPWCVVLGAAAGGLIALVIGGLVHVRILRRATEGQRRSSTAERQAEVTALTRGLAHEIKNPLSTIGLNAQLMGEAINDLEIDQDSRTSISRRVGTLTREIERLKGILSDFLEFAGEVRLVPTPTDLNVLVDELIDFFLPQAEQHGVRLRADLSREPLIAFIDGQLLKQTILNLMLNAVQAFPSGKEHSSDGPRELILRTERRRSRVGRGDEVVLHVIDTGPGIPAERHKTIFEPYFTTKGGGTGLGLPIARRIVESHGGRLELHSEPGKGSDFSVILAAMNPARPEATGAAAGAGAAQDAPIDVRTSQSSGKNT